MKNKDAVIYINGRLLAVSMQMDNCKSKEEFKKLKEEYDFLNYARDLIEKLVKKNKKSGL